MKFQESELSFRFSMAVQKWLPKLKGRVVETSTFSIYAIWHLNFKAPLKVVEYELAWRERG